MELNKINSLVELFFKKYLEITKKNNDEPFLKWLKNDEVDFLGILEKSDLLFLLYTDYKIVLKDYYGFLYS